MPLQVERESTVEPGRQAVYSWRFPWFQFVQHFIQFPNGERGSVHVSSLCLVVQLR